MLQNSEALAREAAAKRLGEEWWAAPSPTVEFLDQMIRGDVHVDTLRAGRLAGGELAELVRTRVEPTRSVSYRNGYTGPLPRWGRKRRNENPYWDTESGWYLTGRDREWELYLLVDGRQVRLDDWQETNSGNRYATQFVKQPSAPVDADVLESFLGSHFPVFRTVRWIRLAWAKPTPP